MPKKYHVNLSENERKQLQALLSKGELSVRKVKRAQILLAADRGKVDEEIAQTLQVHVNTVERIRKRLVEGGLDHALTEDYRPGGKSKLDGKDEAVLVALACSDPPAGRAQWTMQLLADHLVTLGIVEQISDETVRKHLKKTN
jgi:transposase